MSGASPRARLTVGTASPLPPGGPGRAQGRPPDPPVGERRHVNHRPGQTGRHAAAGAGMAQPLCLDRKVRGEAVFRTVFLYPFALSFIVTGLVWQWILNPEFGIERVVRSLGWEGFSFDPLHDPALVLYGILIAGIWQGTGLVMVIMLAGLRGIDEDIWKAARIDGIPTWKTYTHVVIPMMRPVFVTALVLVASGIVKVYDLVVAQTSGGPGIASQMPALYVMDRMFKDQNLAQGFAASTMMLVTVAIILIPWAWLEFGGKKRG
ncbi:MAG: sugar ABC transporter permease [Rubellimicrobium sp.]|nr:sugar ABC transporter permease [Rubellimicrobium sp.]